MYHILTNFYIDISVTNFVQIIISLSSGGLAKDAGMQLHLEPKFQKIILINSFYISGGPDKMYVIKT